MLDAIRGAHQRLVAATQAFNAQWPAAVAGGEVWTLPVLSRQKALDVICPQRLSGTAAIAAAQRAYAGYSREPGQAPGTVLRLPGYFLVNASLLAPVREINALKDALAASVEAARVALNLVPAARPPLMRQALGGQFSMMQLTRHIQCFDAAPRRLQFTWAGHTAGAEKLPVGQVRELLRARACSQAAELGVPLEQTPAAFELRSLVNLADEALLLRYKTLAPHPRAMLWFSAAGRYDAMVHANLPLLVRADPAQTPCVRPLPDFDREQRRAPRPDLKPRVAVIPRLNLYLPGEPRQRPARAPAAPPVPST